MAENQSVNLDFTISEPIIPFRRKTGLSGVLCGVATKPPDWTERPTTDGSHGFVQRLGTVKCWRDLLVCSKVKANDLRRAVFRRPTRRAVHKAESQFINTA